MLKKLDNFENKLLKDFEQGKLKSISPSKTDLTKFKAAATATLCTKKTRKLGRNASI